MRRLAAAFVMLLAACTSDVPTLATTPATSTTSATGPSTTVSTSSTTTTTRVPGPTATFRAAGRTLQVKPSNRRKPYAELGDQLAVPAGIQVEFGAPGVDDAAGTVLQRVVWDGGAAGDPLDVAATGEPGRFIWVASVAPGEYGLEVTLTVTGIPVLYRAPVNVTA